jgi:hypothetical protein
MPLFAAVYVSLKFSMSVLTATALEKIAIASRRDSIKMFEADEAFMKYFEANEYRAEEINVTDIFREGGSVPGFLIPRLCSACAKSASLAS